MSACECMDDSASSYIKADCATLFLRRDCHLTCELRSCDEKFIRLLYRHSNRFLKLHRKHSRRQLRSPYAFSLTETHPSDKMTQFSRVPGFQFNALRISTGTVVCPLELMCDSAVLPASMPTARRKSRPIDCQYSRPTSPSDIDNSWIFRSAMSMSILLPEGIAIPPENLWSFIAGSMHCPQPLDNTFLSVRATNTLLSIEQHQMRLERQEVGAQGVAPVNGVVKGKPVL